MTLAVPIQAAHHAVPDAYLSLGLTVPEDIPVDVIDMNDDVVWLRVLDAPLELVMLPATFARFAHEID